jgi:hypothetical protein
VGACLWPRGATAGDNKPNYFDGHPLDGAIQSGKEYKWQPRQSPIVLGIVNINDQRELFTIFNEVTIKSAATGLTARCQRQGFSLKASPEAEGKTFEGTIDYEVQPQVFYGFFHRWVNYGAAQARTSTFKVTVAMADPPRVVIAVNGRRELAMAGEAKAKTFSGRSSVADLRVDNSRRPVVLGKKPGRDTLKLKYTIDERVFELKIPVQVVDQELAVPIALEPGASETVLPDRWAAQTSLKDWNLEELLGVEKPSLATVKREQNALKVSGLDRGKTQLAAVYSAREETPAGKRRVTVKVKLDLVIGRPGEKAESGARARKRQKDPPPPEE